MNHLIQYIHKMFCFGFDSSYHAQLSNENLHYINLDSILLTVQMSLPINYLPYLYLYRFDFEWANIESRIIVNLLELKSIFICIRADPIFKSFFRVLACQKSILAPKMRSPNI